jgi:hypothetical protein
MMYKVIRYQIPLVARAESICVCKTRTEAWRTVSELSVQEQEGYSYTVIDFDENKVMSISKS